MKRTVAAVGLALLLATAGCSDLLPFGDRDPPDDDRLGWENGHWYDDDLDVTTDDGLNASEREAVVARTMARVEQVRELEFDETVPVEVISRAEYRNRSGGGENSTFSAWNDQIWEALFLVGENDSFDDARETVFGTSVLGYYSPSKDEIVIVSDSETPMLDTRTLAHELVHALQDQHYALPIDATTQDAQLAGRGLTEGDANVVESIYDDRCSSGWGCLSRPERSGGGESPDFNFGVFLAVYAPYAEGPEFVRDLRSRGDGWSAVDAAYDDPPASTEQVIHPDAYPDEAPETVQVPDRSSDEWRRFDLDQQYDTVGEASVYAMFWANGRVDRSRSPYNYSHPLSAGWAGDRVVPYTNGSAGGYVWKLTFDSGVDAREFHDAYVEVLESRDARQPRDGTYVVPEDDPFADAFRVDRSGETVTVVNAPTRGDLAEIHG